MKYISSNWTLQWCHYGRDGVKNHQPQNCLLNPLFWLKSKETSKLRVTGLCARISPVIGEFPAQMASNAEKVSIWWRAALHNQDLHCGLLSTICILNYSLEYNFNRPVNCVRLSQLQSLRDKVEFMIGNIASRDNNWTQLMSTTMYRIEMTPHSTARFKNKSRLPAKHICVKHKFDKHRILTDFAGAGSREWQTLINHLTVAGYVRNVLGLDSPQLALVLQLTWITE